MIPTIVHGPMACGKTRNAERLRQLTGCATVIDGWDFHMPFPTGNVLVLTYLTADELDQFARRTGKQFSLRDFRSFDLRGAR